MSFFVVKRKNIDMKSKIAFELLWIVLTFVLVCLVLLPIYMTIGDTYAFYKDNSLLIIISITFIRYIFLLKHHWIVESKWFKIILIFFPIVVLFFLLDVLYNFQLFVDQEGITSIMNEINYESQNQMTLYIKTEMIFFWVAAFISNALLPFRMIISLWRKLNKGTH
jgi:hypothetical protein